MTAKHLHAQPLTGKKRRCQLHALVAGLERQQEKLFAEQKRRQATSGGSVVEVMPIADAVRHPIFGPHVLQAAITTGLVATGAAPVPHGNGCFTCGEAWRLLAREPRAAVLGSPRDEGAGFVGFVCEPCMSRGLPSVVEMFKVVVRDLLGGTDVRGGIMPPGGRA